MGEQIRFPHGNRSASKQIGFPHREYLRASRSGFLRGGKSSTCLLIIPDPSANMSSDTPSEHSGRTFSFSPMPNFCSPNTGEDGDRSLDPDKREATLGLTWVSLIMIGTVYTMIATIETMIATIETMIDTIETVDTMITNIETMIVTIETVGTMI